MVSLSYFMYSTQSINVKIYVIFYIVKSTWFIHSTNIGPGFALDVEDTSEKRASRFQFFWGWYDSKRDKQVN